ncbi:MAG: c-type cytochrome [Nitrospirae bacterium]|nr:c-type cytochrome [Nitrospirota bacterium]
MRKFMSGVIFAILAFVNNADAVDSKIAQGRELFMTNCSVCHGEKGDSKGQVCFSSNIEKSGKVLHIMARDFTVGVFKFRTTSTGCLPKDSDLLQTVSNGIPKSFMPSFADLSLQERDALVEYIKSFSSRWTEEPACNAIAVVKPKWVGTPESIRKGEMIYKNVKCWECHGDTGKGDGKKSEDLKDDWGHKILPFDFTTGTLKRGTSPEAIYITFSTGLDGSGMPSYEDSLKEEDRWHLVSYTLKLMGM